MMTMFGGRLDPEQIRLTANRRNKRATTRSLMPRRLESNHHSFGLRVEVQDFVTHFTAPAGLFVATEGQGGIEDVVTIDPNGAGTNRGSRAMGLGNVLRPDAGSQTVIGIVRARDQF